MGINDALRKAGAQQSDLVLIANYEFNFDDEGMYDSSVP